MTRQFNIKCLYHGKIIDAKILLIFIANGVTLLEYSDDTESLKFRDPHIFTSFCNLRKYLATKNKLLLCKGCRIDVHSRKLATTFAYVLKKDVQPDPDKDKVMIFDEEAEIDKIGTVEEQYQFFLDWYKSIKKGLR